LRGGKTGYTTHLGDGWGVEKKALAASSEYALLSHLIAVAFRDLDPFIWPALPDLEITMCDFFVCCDVLNSHVLSAWKFSGVSILLSNSQSKT
jgi:hypothetical protein